MRTKIISLFAGLVALISVATARSQVATNSIPLLDSPIVDFLSRSNLIGASYVIYDTKTHNAGGGVALAYKLSEFVVPTLRVDYINGRLWSPSASLQLQVPITVAGKFQFTPLIYDGVATALTGANSFEPINIAGVGAAIGFHSTKWYIPAGIVLDYERWTGGGMNDNQFRAGPYWKF